MKLKSDKVFFFIQSIVKYNSFNLGITLRSILYKPFFKSFGTNIQIKDGVTFKYPSDISIGNNAKIGEFSYFVGKGGLTIGNDLLLGAGTKIITSSHEHQDSTLTIREQGLKFLPITIGNNIWFGFDCKVFGGVQIGNNVIVGTNTLINKGKIDDNLIIAGTPYKIINNR
jgi:maltose O-acetyltransferase